MKKKEFLNILNEALLGEVSPDIIEQNLEYYSQYIGNDSFREKSVVEELGDPRLIARTIIESERIAKEKGKYTENKYYNNGYENDLNREEKESQGTKQSRSFAFGNIKWYHKFLLILIILALLAILIIIGQVIIRILFVFGLPIILILLLFSMFRRR
ncbi:MAG: putative rane protein [Herbinix sp.]|nr:putative rane protein [Herbinix sp.]